MKRLIAVILLISACSTKSATQKQLDQTQYLLSNTQDMIKRETEARNHWMGINSLEARMHQQRIDSLMHVSDSLANNLMELTYKMLQEK